MPVSHIHNSNPRLIKHTNSGILEVGTRTTSHQQYGNNLHPAPGIAELHQKGFKTIIELPQSSLLDAQQEDNQDEDLFDDEDED